MDAEGRIYLVRDDYTNEADSVSRPLYTGSTKVKRLTASGDPDNSYGSGAGVITLHSSFQALSPGLTDLFRVLPDGTVFHTSILGEGRRSLSRTDPDGVTNLRDEYAVSRALAGSVDYFPALQADLVRSQSDGKTLFISRRVEAWQIGRLNADGSIDRAFGNNGTATLDIEPQFSTAVPQLPDGKLLFGGRRAVEGGTFEVQRIITDAEEVPTAAVNRRGTLMVQGTSNDDAASVHLRLRDGRLVARVGDFVRSFAPSSVKRVAFFLGFGDDTLAVSETVTRGVYAEGGDGADTLNGGHGDDVFLGGTGPDQLFGHDGNDKLVGGGGNDYLLGGAGKDDLFGQGGSDTLSGAGGNDRLFGGPDSADRILGGAGGDAAADEDKDTFDSVESLI